MTKRNLVVITNVVVALMTCFSIALFLLQERGGDLFRDEANDDYAMKFAL